MELDSRIIEGKKPLTCFDAEQARNFVGKKCYLTNDISLFSDLDVFKDIEGCKSVPNEYDGIINTLSDIDTEISMVFETTYLRWKFCIPCEWVTEEKKFRPFRLREFLHKFKFGEAIHMRPKNSKTKVERMVIFSEYRTELYKDESNASESVCLTGIEHHLKSVVCLGVREYDLTTLFDNYEYFDGKEWKIFGVEE